MVFALFSCLGFVNLALSECTGMGIILDSAQKDCRNKQAKPAVFGRHIYNFSTQVIEIGIGGPEVQGHLQLFVRLKVNLGH